jgi:uncharacterized membrane protein YdfJ with MMPL/SSD domain
VKKKILGVAFASALIMSIVSAMPASARPGATVTVVCSGGQGVVSDAQSFFGQTTANGVYNQVNPFGEVCTVYP